MFLYINLFWAPVKVHSSHRFVTQTEMIVSRAEIILMPASMQSIDLLFFLLRNSFHIGHAVLRKIGF